MADQDRIRDVITAHPELTKEEVVKKCQEIGIVASGLDVWRAAKAMRVNLRPHPPGPPVPPTEEDLLETAKGVVSSCGSKEKAIESVLAVKQMNENGERLEWEQATFNQEGGPDLCSAQELIDSAGDAERAITILTALK